MQGRRAGPVSRIVADAVDLVVAIVATLMLYVGIAGVRFVIAPRRFSWPTLGGLRLGMLVWGLLLLYLTAAWSGTGRSFGKQLMGLRVERLDGRRLGVAHSFVRALLCIVFPIGLAWSFVSRGSASVQDLLLRTRVVYDWRPHIRVNGRG
jgi:uncharacterized RDD family membrane protein YckC